MEAHDDARGMGGMIWLDALDVLVIKSIVGAGALDHGRYIGTHKVVL